VPFHYAHSNCSDNGTPTKPFSLLPSPLTSVGLPM
jgi:hypothetical protein